MGAWTGKRERPRPDMDNARSLEQSRRYKYSPSQQDCIIIYSSKTQETAVRRFESSSRHLTIVFGYPFGINTIFPITPPPPSNSCAYLAWHRGSRCAIRGLIFFCCSSSNSVDKSFRNHVGLSRIIH